MTLGPHTKKALRDANVADEHIAGIEGGDYEWNISLVPAVAHARGAENVELVNWMAAELFQRKDFCVTVSRTEGAHRAVDPGCTCADTILS
jgi:hypothetical protein